MRLTAFSPALLLLLASCGGDGGSSPAPMPTPTPTPTPSGPNTAPGFTSAATASAVENGTLAQQVTTSDAQNDPVVLSMTGDADMALFALDVTGRLTFRMPPNFDVPGDANADNIYEVTLTASDGRATATQDLRVTVSNSREGIAVRRIATGFTQPVQVHRIAGNPNELYVIEKGGNLYRLTIATGARTLLLTVGNLSTDGERGLLGITSGPASLGGGTALYVVATAADGAVQVRQYALTSGGAVAPTPTVLLSVPHAAFSNHNGGWIDFGPDGLLYMGIGDGGGGGDPDNNAQNPNVPLGKILRFALSANGWGPAPGNPYAGGGGNPYVFALGLRNPFRNSFDGTSLLIGDVGQSAREEIDLITTASAGANLGWPILEGILPFRGSAPGGLIAPVLQYGRGNGPYQGATVIGGRVYRGPIAGIAGHYVFGDFISGHIWSVPFTSLVPGQTLDGRGFELRDADFAPDAGTIDSPVSFNADEAGTLYIVDLDGEIFQVVAAL